jgi:hypothetical protein
VRVTTLSRIAKRRNPSGGCLNFENIAITLSGISLAE